MSGIQCLRAGRTMLSTTVTGEFSSERERLRPNQPRTRIAAIAAAEDLHPRSVVGGCLMQETSPTSLRFPLCDHLFARSEIVHARKGCADVRDR